MNWDLGLYLDSLWKNIRNNLKQSWTQLLEGETLEDLFDGVYGAVEIHKLDVW